MGKETGNNYFIMFRAFPHDIRKNLLKILFYFLIFSFLKAGDVVIMDNLSAHKSSRITKSIEEHGANILYLPPYSPDLNPIEKMWSKIKSILRQAEARTYEELIKAIKTALEKITPLDAKNWFKSCGYYS